MSELFFYAYVRRKKWESRLLAVSVINALGEAMGSKKSKGWGRRVAAADMLTEFGVDTDGD